MASSVMGRARRAGRSFDCSRRRAPTRWAMAASLAKGPTTSTRRLISLSRRMTGLVDCRPIRFTALGVHASQRSTLHITRLRTTAGPSPCHWACMRGAHQVPGESTWLVRHRTLAVHQNFALPTQATALGPELRLRHALELLRGVLWRSTGPDQRRQLPSDPHRVGKPRMPASRAHSSYAPCSLRNRPLDHMGTPPFHRPDRARHSENAG